MEDRTLCEADGGLELRFAAPDSVHKTCGVERSEFVLGRERRPSQSWGTGGSGLSSISAQGSFASVISRVQTSASRLDEEVFSSKRCLSIHAYASKLIERERETEAE